MGKVLTVFVLLLVFVSVAFAQDAIDMNPHFECTANGVKIEVDFEARGDYTFSCNDPEFAGTVNDLVLASTELVAGNVSLWYVGVIHNDFQRDVGNANYFVPFTTDADLIGDDILPYTYWQDSSQHCVSGLVYMHTDGQLYNIYLSRYDITMEQCYLIDDYTQHLDWGDDGYILADPSRRLYTAGYVVKDGVIRLGLRNMSVSVVLSFPN